MGCAITTISSNLTEMSKGVKLLAALMEDDVGGGNDLMRAARTLAGAVSDLLKAVEPASGEVRHGADRTTELHPFTPDAAALLPVFQDLKCSRFCRDAVVNASLRS